MTGFLPDPCLIVVELLLLLLDTEDLTCIPAQAL
jgi:hypothetical protein